MIRNIVASPKMRALGLSALAVLLPFFIGMLVVQLIVRCAHCRAVWLTNWPILPAVIPSYLLGLRFGGWSFYLILGFISAAFVAGVFLLSYGSRYRRGILMGTGIAFSLLAVLTHCLIAA